MTVEDSLRRELTGVFERYAQHNLRVNSVQVDWLDIGTIAEPLRTKLLKIHLSVTTKNIGDPKA